MGTPYFSSCSSVVCDFALPTVSAVMGSSGLSGESIFDKIDWNLLKVSGGIPLFSDMILEKQSKQSHYMSRVMRKPVLLLKHLLYTRFVKT